MDDPVVRFGGENLDFHAMRPGRGSTRCGRPTPIVAGPGSRRTVMTRDEAERARLQPCERCFSAAVVVRRRTADEIADAIGRLHAAGLTDEAAQRVALHPTWGPVVLGPGVIVALFPARAAPAEEVA